MFVFSNLATSLDGKIATADRSYFPLGTPADRKQMQVLRKRADAVLMGASTLRTYRRFCGVAKARRQPANIIVSRSLEGIDPDWEFFSDPSLRRILFITRPLSRKRLQRFASSSEVIVLDPDHPVAAQIVDVLDALGFRNLLVEGGGGTMWDFASQNLIDEYHVTVTPRILGGADAPTLVDGAGFKAKDSLRLKLKSCRRVGDELYLVYEKR